MNNNNIKLISFDLFDTLVHYKRAIWFFLFLRMSLKSPKLYNELIALRKKSVITDDFAGNILYRNEPLNHQEINYFQDKLNEELYSIKIFKDALYILPLLQNAGYKIAITSNLAKDFWKPSLEILPIKPDFTFLSFSMGIRKPNPLVFKNIIKKTGYTGEQIVHIGDKFKNDYESALWAKINAIHLDRKAKGEGENYISSLFQLEKRFL